MVIIKSSSGSNSSGSDNHGCKGTGSLSLNAAMLTAVLLASRLYSLSLVLLFVVLSVVLFSLLPIAIRIVYVHSRLAHLGVTLGFAWSTAALLRSICADTGRAVSVAATNALAINNTTTATEATYTELPGLKVCYHIKKNKIW